MTVVKTRQIGNSLSITIPKEFEIPQGQEYNVYKGRDGTLIFSPSKENLLEEATDELIREKMIDELGAIIDRNMAEIEAGNYVTIEEMEAELLG
ncbi:type II toxin-antitoxin system PemI/MazE family antitoxin [Streptococcus pyogenes]|uniref:type II toxin-antitoxin system PemI/MazE family antitoxin n=1 Tax=Streptococcus pyogenes TaxID=1314 RepID=UPI0010A172E6|nr:hypothetical protein [Streptococcus pyogenes]VHB04864.1 AbrB superfamily transcriptional regulator [Streptococcus pyogenes]VHB47269.1 AbrB superfamily transcriptional regulator [Streptococcus pyogenes]VHB51079.1 AbrB superfamily transcriptional regulator [Streptococcus pyogenes]VHB67810.1 AbrB superfamily transcriptional regulator [Streptococcus pyogenes]VHM43743.1 AbrB superfamily transcriptional regulator [Streptococcus pyogenes]